MRAGTLYFVTLLLASAFQPALGQPALTDPGATTEKPATHMVPTWRSKATGEDMMRVYPQRALRKREAGIALVQCKVTREGEMAECTVEQEAPNGLGFGEAALKLMPRFKMEPTTGSGSPVEGGVVRLPLQFRPPN